MWVANVGREWESRNVSREYESRMGVAKWGHENKKIRGAYVIGIPKGVIN